MAAYLGCDAIKEEPQYCDVSNYAMQLTPFIELFGRKRIVKCADIGGAAASCPIETLEKLWKWLEVDCSV